MHDERTNPSMHHSTEGLFFLSQALSITKENFGFGFVFVLAHEEPISTYKKACTYKGVGMVYSSTSESGSPLNFLNGASQLEEQKTYVNSTVINDVKTPSSGTSSNTNKDNDQITNKVETTTTTTVAPVMGGMG